MSAGTAAISADVKSAPRVAMTHEQRKEKRRAYMAAKYLLPEFRERHRAAMTELYHKRVTNARFGVRGRRPKSESRSPSPIDGGIPAAAVILAGAALGAAVAAML
jgi:hypothetical protein